MSRHLRPPSGVVLAAVALAGALLAACGAPVALPPSEAPSGSGAPTAEAGDAHPDAVWFEVLGVSQEGGEIGSVDLATDDEDLAVLWDAESFEGAAPPIDLAQHVVVVVVRPEDACPDDLVEARLVDGLLDTTFLPPPGACNQPLLPTAFAIAFHRADLPEEVTVRFAAHEGHGGDITATFALPPYDGPPAPAPSPPPRRMDAAALDAVFADAPVRRCSELPDPRAAALGGGPSPLQAQLGDVPDDIQGRYAAEHAETFGWLLLDSNADELVVGVTEDAAGHRQRLAERHPDVPIRVELTPFSQRDLLAAQEAVLPLHHAGVVSSSSAFSHLELGVVDPSPEDLDAIAALVDPAMACVDPILSGLPDAADPARPATGEGG